MKHYLQNWSDNIENIPDIYISYCLYKKRIPVELASKHLKNTDYSICSDILLISGGLIDYSPTIPHVCRTGIIGVDTGRIGSYAAQRIVQSIVDPQDGVVIIDEYIIESSEKWTESYSNTDVQISRTNDSFMICMQANQLDCLPWCEHLLPASLSSLYAFRNPNTPLLRDLADVLTTNGNVMNVVNRQNRLFARNPNAALEALGDYHIWTLFGGLDGSEMVVVSPEFDENALASIFANVSIDLDIPVYFEGISENPNGSILTESWMPIPDSWQLIS